MFTALNKVKMWFSYFRKNWQKPVYEKLQHTSIETDNNNYNKNNNNSNGEDNNNRTVYRSGFPDDNNTNSRFPPSWRRIDWRIISEFITLAITITLVWYTSRAPRMSLLDERNPSDGLTFTGGQLTFIQHLSRRPCGNTPEDAVARGCDFDHVTTSWLPPQCIDYELQEDFLTSIKPEGWRFWADDGKKQEHEANKIGFVRDEIWATNEWHMWHCLYVWRKLTRSIRAGRPVDGSTLSLTHTDHCAHMTGAEYATTQSEVRTLVSINYPPC